VDAGLVWNFADVEEPASCTSRYVGHGSALGPLVCGVNHAETGEASHCAPLDGVFFRWSDTESAAALRAQSWTCLYCQAPCSPYGLRGCCSYGCALAENDAADNYETETEIDA
jgi:hypothetical protein